MRNFAARLPFSNFAGLDLREVDRELELFVRRRAFPPFERRFDEREPLRLRRARPVARERVDCPGKASVASENRELTMHHLAPGPALGAFCNRRVASSSSSSSPSMIVGSRFETN